MSLSSISLYTTLPHTYILSLSFSFQGEMGWMKEKVDVLTWLQYYASRRYGSYSKYAETAWEILKYSAYSHHYSGGIKSLVDRGPGFGMTVDTSFNVTGLVDAWLLLYEASKTDTLSSIVGPYQYDLVDIGRQCLTDLFYDLYRMFSLAYDKYTQHGVNSINEMTSIANEMKSLLQHLDDYLGTNVNFLLGNWINDARKSSPPNSSDSVVNNLEFNARNQITMWGPHQNIEDYASKEWSGLVKDYYLPRWSLFIQYAMNSVSSKKPFDNSGYQAARYQLENDFSNTIKTYPTQPKGDLMQITGELINKYIAEADFNNNYDRLINSDISDNNLFGGNNGPWTRNIFQVTYLCNINPTCVAFTSEGYLKNSTASIISSPGATVYVKKLFHKV